MYLLTIDISSIPVRHDVYSTLIGAGVVQAIFIAFVLLFKSKFKNQLQVLLGILILSIGIILLDLYLCYTGLMARVVYLNDGSEWISLLLPPLIYLCIWTMLKREKIVLNEHWPHLILPGLYFVNMWFYWLQPLEHKFNAYIDAYFPDLPLLSYSRDFSYDPFGIKSMIDLLLVLSFGYYLILIIRELHKVYGLKKFILMSKDSNRFQFTFNILITSLISVALIISVESSYERDSGDHIMALFMTVLIFSLSYDLITKSKFFDKSWIANKYETSGITSDQTEALFRRIQILSQSWTENDLHDINLQFLAKELNVPSNYISQAVKVKTQNGFNDYLNKIRIHHAKKLLTNPEFSNHTIEAIGQKVGFKSKSGFYTAFKKVTALTPKEFLNTTK